MSDEQPSGIAHYLAELVRRIESERFSPEERRQVRQHMLDAVAAAFIGCRGKAFEDLTRLCPRMPEGCGWPGGGPLRTHPVDGGMAWAFAINASVFEDGSREGACHPASAVIPVIAALSAGKSWEAIDKAVIAGYDVMVRLARSGNPAFARRGFHPTAITAPFGAAATASLLLGHDLLKTRNALCLASMGSAGLMASFRSGETQPLQVAWGVRSGIASAMLAGCGHSGYPRIIEEGFYPAYLGDHRPSRIDLPLQYQYALRGSYLKPYPGCRHLHPPIDALAGILKREKIEARQLKAVRVRTYRLAVETEIHALKCRGDAYFNIPYALAARIVLGRNDWDSFDERHFADERLREIMQKVEVCIDPEVDGLYPAQRASVVEVHTTDGSVHTGKVSFARGEPENSLPGPAVIEKFRKAARSFLSERSMDLLETMLDVPLPTATAEALFEASTENAGTV